MLPRVNELENEEVCVGLRILNPRLLLGVSILKSSPNDLSCLSIVTLQEANRGAGV